MSRKKRVSHKLVHGVGHNDHTYMAKQEDGTYAKSYRLWVKMLARCYSQKIHKDFPSYIACEVSENFKSYTFFKEWCDKQVGYNDLDDCGGAFQLDKDLLVKGNKVYSEDTYCFVPKRVNNLLIKTEARRGEHPIGVHVAKGGKKFITHIGLENSKRLYLGSFTTAQEAFQTYKIEKEIIIKAVAEQWKGRVDDRVYQALINYQVEITD